MTEPPTEWPSAPAEGWGIDPVSPAPDQPPYGPSYGSGRAQPRRNGAVACGVVALVLAVLAPVVGLFGLLTFVTSGPALLWVALAAGLVAAVLAVVGLVLAVRSGGGAGGRLARALPSAAALLVLGGLLGAGQFQEEPADIGTDFARTLPADAPPLVVADEAAYALWIGDADRACSLLAERARVPSCRADAAFSRDVRIPGEIAVVRVSATRALLAHDHPFSETRTHRLRLERGPEGWVLLDLPWSPSECVDTARDPFRCPVYQVGTVME